MSTTDIRSFDHVALWTDSREEIAAFLCDPLGMHVISRADDFTLLGAHAREGKVTLFDADGPRDPGVLDRIGIRVDDLAAVAARVGEHVDLVPGEEGVEALAPGGVAISLVERPGLSFDLDHVALAVPDPEATMAGLEEMGFGRRDGHLEIGDRRVLVEEGQPDGDERPLLNHLAVLVDSAEAARERAERAGRQVEKVVDAENTYAVFVRGPDGITVEYVEHKPGFSLV